VKRLSIALSFLRITAPVHAQSVRPERSVVAEALPETASADPPDAPRVGS